MIKRLRFKFIIISMVSLVLLVLITNISTNVVMSKANESQVDNMLRQAIIARTSQPVRSSGKTTLLNPEKVNEIIMFEYNENNVISYQGENKQFDEIANSIMAMDVEISSYESYRFLKENNMLAFIDRSTQDAMLTDLRLITYYVSLASIVILSIITFFLSKLITEPINIAFKNQKRFISNSSHEFKTPLAILLANLEMFQMKHGEDKYLSEIKNQSLRMNELVNGLLTLSQNDENLSKKKFDRFNLSECISRNSFSFEALAYEKKKMLVNHIEEDVYISANEKSITELFEALMDNAIKYSPKESLIDVNLYTKSGRKILEVKNRCERVSDEDKEKLFDTFYRIDDSRNSETGGHGLGLSIVKSIVEIHKGKIEVDNGEAYIMFRIIF